MVKNKRMFSLDVVDNYSFLKLPQRSQCLYFHLSMRADDDGIVGNPNRLLKYLEATNDDLEELIAAEFIIRLGENVIAIRDWNINNYIRKDRYSPTRYTKEKEQLYLEEDGTYILKEVGNYVDCQPTTTNDNQRQSHVNQRSPSLDKSSLDKIRLDKSSLDIGQPSLDKSSPDKISLDKSSLDNFFDEKNIKINSFQKKNLELLLQDWTDINSAEAENIVVCALEIADEKINNRASLVNYASTVLTNWKEKNLTTLQQIKKHLKTKSPIRRTEVIPEWAKDNYRPPTIDKKDIPTKEALEEQRKQLEQQLN